MTNSEIAIIILAAGKGTRMKSNIHKVLHPLGGRPMLHHLLDTIANLNPTRKVIVVGADKEQVKNSVGSVAEIVVQEPQHGTGHAVQVTKKAMAGFNGDVLILYGDVPLICEKTMQKMLSARKGTNSASVVVLGFRVDDPKAYGRLKVNKNGNLDAIVEHKDANDEERAITLCNSGIMAIDGQKLYGLLDALDNNNAANEYYLTDIVKIANSKGLRCAVVETSAQEVMGINSRSELAEAEAIFQNTKRESFMTEGVTLQDPTSVYFSYDTKIGKDVTIAPNVYFGSGVEIDDTVTIHAFCHIEGAKIRSGASIGPYARLRPAADIGEDAKVGNFVEIKKSKIEKGAKISHLSYIGDATIGENANVGAGTITCNYDGYFKYKTEIGAGAFIGSNTSLVAPVKIGAGAIIGAGSVITKDTDQDALALTRSTQKQIGGWAADFRNKQKKKKETK
ncbi:MAG: bifunctional UDP-N-acetylglucosamine diphosphorylase/glucosamine-1-phosphate N-acetyltransferase GlmU [Proteobacteria bacterium]|jgi:bifunctional UDP-N-acetylglucosamine pyrophosphorylase / glucosamine-1-phosphate N-acetyltransferase|nr:bifunctional UDP-N-acetylglucosamine diphosphorylase/glucosamine-1-phosphate N-acetyltransferase GlmU [Pseudomonadota bacterium]